MSEGEQGGEGFTAAMFIHNWINPQASQSDQPAGFHGPATALSLGAPEWYGRSLCSPGALTGQRKKRKGLGPHSRPLVCQHLRSPVSGLE